MKTRSVIEMCDEFEQINYVNGLTVSTVQDLFTVLINQGRIINNLENEITVHRDKLDKIQKEMSAYKLDCIIHED